MPGRNPTNAELVEQFVALAHAIRHRANARMSAAGLSLVKFRVLSVLLENERMRMNELSTALGVVPRTITTTIDSLEKQGLVVRVRDPRDRRATLLETTESGRNQLYEFRKTRHHADAADVFDVLSRAEKRQLDELLDRLRTGIDAAGTTHSSASPPTHTLPRESHNPTAGKEKAG